MTPWKVLVVDDDPPAKRMASALLAQFDGVEVVGECDDAGAAVRAIRQLEPDILFIDVQMPGATSLDMLHIPGLSTIPLVVFTTGEAEHVLMATDVHAFDYLLKPFSDERFMRVMAKVLTALDRASSVTFTAVPRELTVHGPENPIVIPVDRVDWVEAEDYCTRIHAGRRRPLVRRSIQSLLEELAGDGFMRASRTAILNLASIREIRPKQNGEAEALLTRGDVVPVSRSYRVQLEHQVRSRDSGALRR